MYHTGRRPRRVRLCAAGVRGAGNACACDQGLRPHRVLCWRPGGTLFADTCCRLAETQMCTRGASCACILRWTRMCLKPLRLANELWCQAALRMAWAYECGINGHICSESRHVTCSWLVCTLRLPAKCFWAFVPASPASVRLFYWVARCFGVYPLGGRRCVHAS